MALPQQIPSQKPVAQKSVSKDPVKKPLNVPKQAVKSVAPAATQSTQQATTSVPLTKSPESNGDVVRPMDGEKKWYMKWWVWILVVLGILLVVGLGVLAFMLL